jgi:hypothetical protein
VDPQEGGEAGERPLLERLLGAPQKVVKFLTEAPVACVSHALSFVKSFWPLARLEAFAQGVLWSVLKNNSTSTSKKPNL